MISINNKVLLFSNLGNGILPIDGSTRTFNGVDITNDGFMVNGDLHIKFFDFWDSIYKKYDKYMNVNPATTIKGIKFHQGKAIKNNY